eukprot:SAG22_NODE_5779_length_953_cov_1.884075_3_plen_28_part_01
MSAPWLVQMMAAAQADNLKRVTLELGGK